MLLLHPLTPVAVAVAVDDEDPATDDGTVMLREGELASRAVLLAADEEREGVDCRRRAAAAAGAGKTGCPLADPVSKQINPLMAS